MGSNEDNPAAFVSLPSIIESHARATPQARAFQVDQQVLSWQALHERMGRVARGLVRAGVAPGQAVALLGGPSLAYVECLFGALAARACVVPLPVSATVENLEALLADCDARVLFIDAQADDAVSAMVDRLAAAGPLRVLRFGHDLPQGDAGFPLPPAHPDDRFNIIYSSGTTGLPKGIVHLHGMRQQQASRASFGFSPRSVTLLSTPMYSNTTLLPMLGTVVHGGSCLLMRKFDAGRFLALAAEHRVTHTMGVPVQYQRLLAHPDFAARDLSSLELSQCTGAPMALSLKQDIVQRWPGRFLEVYGLTEGGVTCLLDAKQHPDKLATVGRAAPGSEVFLIDDTGRRLPEGDVSATGEVVGRSPLMMAGYHQRPEATAQIRWHDEHGQAYHRSGDIGRFDADGFLTLLDRLKDVIISGGHNVYASDLEAVLARHADVADAAVIGVPSEQWGETPLALVVARDGAALDPAQLRDWVNAQVGRHQRLHAVELRAELPRNALGKLSKKELKVPYWAATAPQKGSA